MRFLYLAKPSMLRDTGGKAGRLKLSHRFDSGGQAALMTRSGVLMQGTLAAHCVNQTLGLLKRLRSNGFVASEDGLADSLDSSTIARTLRRKVLVASNGLTGTFASLFSISHLGIPKKECLLGQAHGFISSRVRPRIREPWARPVYVYNVAYRNERGRIISPLISKSATF